MRLQTPDEVTPDITKTDLIKTLKRGTLDYFWLANDSRYLLAFRHMDDTYEVEAWDGKAGEEGLDHVPFHRLPGMFLGFLERDTGWRSWCRWRAIEPSPQGGLPIALHVALVYVCAAVLVAVGGLTGFVIGHRVNPETEISAIVMALMLAPALAMATPYLARRLRARCPACRHAAIWRCSATNFVYTCPACGEVHIRGRAGAAPMRRRGAG